MIEKCLNNKTLVYWGTCARNHFWHQWWEWAKRPVRQAYRQWECSHTLARLTAPRVHLSNSGIGVSGDPRGSTSHTGPTHAPGSRLRELPWVPPQGTCAIIRGGSSRLPRIPRDPLSGHMTVHLKVRPGKSRISGRSNHHTCNTRQRKINVLNDMDILFLRILTRICFKRMEYTSR